MGFEQPSVDSPEKSLEGKELYVEEISKHIDNCLKLETILLKLRPEGLTTGVTVSELDKIRDFLVNLRDHVVDAKPLKELDDYSKKELINASMELEKTITTIVATSKGEKISEDEIRNVYEARLFIRDILGV